MKNTVKVFNDNGRVTPTKVKINGSPIAINSIDYHADPVSAPTFTLDMPSLVDIEVNHADILFRFTQDTLSAAVKVIQHELKFDMAFREAFLASIESALKESKPYTREHDLAVAILDRISGLEGDGMAGDMPPCDNEVCNDKLKAEDINP